MYQRYEAWHYGNCPEWLQLGVVPITAGALLAESNYEVRPRLLKEYYLVWLRGGSGSMQSKGHQFHLKKWDLFLLYPGVVHAYQTDPQDLFDMFWIGFQGVSAKSLVETAGFSPEAPVFSCAGHPQLLQSLENLSQISAQGNLSNPKAYRIRSAVLCFLMCFFHAGRKDFTVLTISGFNKAFLLPHSDFTQQLSRNAAEHP